jgi:hypothetical protein
VRDLWDEGSFIMGFKTADDARAEAARLNGHGEPHLTIVGEDYQPPAEADERKIQSENVEDMEIPF